MVSSQFHLSWSRNDCLFLIQTNARYTIYFHKCFSLSYLNSILLLDMMAALQEYVRASLSWIIIHEILGSTHKTDTDFSWQLYATTLTILILVLLIILAPLLCTVCLCLRSRCKQKKEDKYVFPITPPSTPEFYRSSSPFSRMSQLDGKHRNVAVSPTPVESHQLSNKRILEETKKILEADSQVSGPGLASRLVRAMKGGKD